MPHRDTGQGELPPYPRRTKEDSDQNRFVEADRSGTFSTDRRSGSTNVQRPGTPSSEPIEKGTNTVGMCLLPTTLMSALPSFLKAFKDEGKNIVQRLTLRGKKCKMKYIV